MEAFECAFIALLIVLVVILVLLSAILLYQALNIAGENLDSALMMQILSQTERQ
ncbi:MAG: hypothetical protein R2865_08930 [Deinococcales bacterium]